MVFCLFHSMIHRLIVSVVFCFFVVVVVCVSCIKTSEQVLMHQCCNQLFCHHKEDMIYMYICECFFLSQICVLCEQKSAEWVLLSIFVCMCGYLTLWI